VSKIEKAAADYRAAVSAVADAEGAIERHEAHMERLLEIRKRSDEACSAARRVLIETAKETP
jgi:hypothetical protein